MRPDKPINSIRWGERHSLKDGASWIAMFLFAIFIILGFIFGVISNNEKHSNQNKEADRELTP